MCTADLRVMREHNLYVTFQLKQTFAEIDLSFVGHMGNKVGNWLFLTLLFKGVVITVLITYMVCQQEGNAEAEAVVVVVVAAVRLRKSHPALRPRPYIPCDTD